MKKTKKQLAFGSIGVILLFALDQITKQLAVACLKNKPNIPIIQDVFELQYLENTSAAFGMDPISLLHNIFQFEIFQNDPALYLNVRMGFFYVLTIVIVLLLCYVYTRIPSEKRFVYMDYILIFFIAGALGNLFDRMTLQYVVDFLYFKLIDFPIFNVADIYVTCAAFAMLGFGLFYYKDEDIEKIFPSQNAKR